jgi:hypothetical protein
MEPVSAAQLDPTQFANVAAPGRDCGTCTLCCKVYEVPALSKPSNKWCSHCTPGKGCGIHETRPGHCRSFFCMWMTEGWIGPEWKPEVSKFVITLDPVSRYQSQFRRWAEAMLPEERLVVIFNGKSGTVITAEGELELGVMGPEDRIQLKLRISPNGPVYDITRNKIPVN